MFLHSEGELALGSRFKALSESLYSIANAAYRESGYDLDAHWFPVLRYLQVKGPASVTQIAAAIGQSHPAVSQLAAKLRQARWITRRIDRADARRGVLELTADAESKLERLGPIWCAIRRGVADASSSGGANLLDSLGAFERGIADGSLAARIRAHHARLQAASVRIQPYRDEWAAQFERINAEWLERWFTLEPVDREMLGDPKSHIIERGGAVLFATLDGEVVGTCALLKEAPGVYELSKMCVRTGFRGCGAGRALLDAAIARFGSLRGKTLFLESSSRLAPALRLYESAGFVHHPAPRPGSHYQRADVYMVYESTAAKPLRARAPRVRVREAGGR